MEALLEVNDGTECLIAPLKKFLSKNDYYLVASFVVAEPALQAHVPDIVTRVIVPIFITHRIPNGKKLDPFTAALLGPSDNHRKFCTFLDDCLAKTKDELKAIVRTYPGIPEDSFKILNGVHELLRREIKKAKYLSSDFLNSRNQDAVNHVFHRYIEWKNRQLTRAQFDDHARYGIEQGEWFQKLFIDRLMQSRDFGEAARWARFNDYYLKLDLSRPPYDRLYVTCAYARTVPGILRHAVIRPYWHERHHIFFIETKTAAEINKLTEIVKSIGLDSIVTLDCEYQTICFDRRTKISLLQFAVNRTKEVYVVDAHSMASEVRVIRQAWVHFLTSLFSSGIHKIFGLGLQGDLDAIKNTFPQFETIRKTRIIQTEVLIPELNKMMPTNPLDAKIGLKRLYESLFTRTLDKSEQLSCFDRRPLRKAQLNYAAMDVIVLQDIYEKLKINSPDPKKFEQCVKKSEKSY
ncbi:hypothetical protein QR680_003834 [Steinernema hermaphroditum]|uniref:3'-5' exonuclease domain-containing protein n=1 Tax=Steinernema hermaphroditum TaxID=289476 RepID=A0AA39LSY6_9BILA|nr:hypothetical protein QR680_003834 [Steinernema hermaphroditum]